MKRADAIVVGSGPNGLAAALTLARAGVTVEVYEAASSPGGGCRTEELTLPGFLHDVCSAVHPLLAASPFFRRTDLTEAGVKLLTPTVAFAHPLDGGRAASVGGTVQETASRLGVDETAYRRLMGPIVEHADRLIATVLSPMRSVPAAPIAAASFALKGLLPAERLAARFRTEEAQALVAGVAAHAVRPLRAPLTGGFGLVMLMLAHSVGWPVVEGGSARVVDALVAELESLGGRVLLDRRVRDLAELPAAKAVLLDVDTNQLLDLAGEQLPEIRRRMLRRFRYGPGVCKVDWALSAAVPWEAEPCRQTATLHLGGTMAEIAHSESEVAAGRHPDRPYCIVVQPSVLDPSRAPTGSQTLWAYCHVPPGSTVDMADRITAQIERFAPGFAELVLARKVETAAVVAERNPNYVGGDITGGAGTLRQTLFRPALQWNPYRTDVEGVYLCSASTPPGGGVHGMCGAGAAAVALSDLGVRRGS